ncbi:hypothetical protein [Streptomyces sp. 6-11-2]|uniref:hypothetical protein n=1 Tax=Streptomyces sp. 6-11-2 TaxID=2585753 RepID=UPI00114434DF|nr:hypothetical protein [Streptomyces sp. 6-11-2]GED89569.1 hypothetical protein TNCT6_66540 [Streptomyces sp. 6-11-2]
MHRSDPVNPDTGDMSANSAGAAAVDVVDDGSSPAGSAVGRALGSIGFKRHRHLRGGPQRRRAGRHGIGTGVHLP